MTESLSAQEKNGERRGPRGGQDGLVGSGAVTVTGALAHAVKASSSHTSDEGHMIFAMAQRFVSGATPRRLNPEACK